MNKAASISIVRKGKATVKYQLVGSIVRYGRGRKNWIVHEAFEADDHSELILFLKLQGTREEGCKFRREIFPMKSMIGFRRKKIHAQLPEHPVVTIQVFDRFQETITVLTA